mgnify:FL=1
MLKKKMCVLLMATAIICSTRGSVMAGNTTDRDIRFNINATNFDKTTGDAAKTDKTAVYLYITSLADNASAYVRAIGVKNSDRMNLTENGTTGKRTDYVTCKEGVKYSAHSQIYEKGYRTAKLAFKSKNIINSEKIIRKWSPDSTKTYTHAWK